MRSLLKRWVIWRDILIVTLLGLPFITPLLRWSSVPCTHDGHLHYHRVVALKHAWQNGLYFSRWMPDLAFGYGYPFFIYREPVPLYAVLGLHGLGLPLPAASNAFYAGCILLAGVFMYAWVRDVFGPLAGVIGAVAYMAAPYQHVDALTRGNLPESIGLMLFPLILWGGRRYILFGTGRAFTVALLGLAVLGLSHNISLLVFTPTLLVYLVAISWLDGKVQVKRIALLMGIGIGLTLWYSGTAVLEMGSVTLNNSVNTRNNDFHYNFTTLAEILGGVSAENPSLLNPPMPLRLGWMPVGLAILGSLSAIRLPTRQQKGHLFLMIAATAGYLFMSLESSLFLWENLPLIDFMQFPWRFVGRAALPVAMLAAIPFATGGDAGRQKIDSEAPSSGLILFGVVCVGFLFLESTPNLYPNWCEEHLYPTITKVFEYEHETGLVGVDPEGSYFPQTVRELPRGSELEAAYASGDRIERFDRSTLPDEATIQTAAYGHNKATVALTTPAQFTARYLTFYFPGWQASVDGERVPITPTDPEGLISFEVPAGAHEIEVRWGWTWPRLALALFSLTMVFCAGLVVVRSGTWRIASSEQSGTSGWWALAVTAIVLLAAKAAVFDRIESPLRETNAPQVDMLGGGLRAGPLQLEGYNFTALEVAAGDTFDIDLAWLAVENPQQQYQSNVWLQKADGTLWSDKETQRPRIYEAVRPMVFWQPGQRVWDSREVQVLAGTPPGEYDLVLTVFELATLAPVTLQDESGPIGPTLAIGRIIITPPAQSIPLTPQINLNQALPNGSTLLGFNLDRETISVGAEFAVSLFWQAENETRLAPLELALVRDSEVVQTWKISAEIAPYDTRSQHILTPSGNLSDGPHELVLDGVTLAEVRVDAPERTFEKPAIALEKAAAFENGIVLEGVNYADSALEIVWRSAELLPLNYHIFIHLVDDAGEIIWQADGQPASWQRPTLGWAVAEFVSDGYTLPENADLSSVRVGLYDPATGQRVLTTDGAEFVVLDDEK